MTHPTPEPPMSGESHPDWLDLPLANYYGTVQVHRWGVRDPATGMWHHYWHLNDYAGNHPVEIPYNLHTALVAFAESNMGKTE